MISEISGHRLAFTERVLLVAASQREAVEAVVRGCGCESEWSWAVSAVEPYNDSSDGKGVSVWAMSIAKTEDAMKVQSALDDVG
jgi:hypothetical protein